MDKNELVKRLKEHLKNKIAPNGKISKDNKCYCLNYIMDFLFCDRKTATYILEHEILV